MEQRENRVEQTQSQGCLGEFAWLGKGFFQPLYRLEFYRGAIRRNAFLAVLFFIVFGGLLALLSTIYITREMSSADRRIEDAFDRGDFPKLTINDGIASVDAQQPFVISEDRDSIFVLDTTGEYRGIDRSRYSGGILLTRDELHILNRGRYQFIRLSDLHELLQMNPIVVDKENAVRLWQGFRGILGIAVFIALGIWDVVIWLMFLCFLAVILWGAARLMNRSAEFGEVLIAGVYAYVPASYVHLLLWLINVRFFGLKTLLLLPIWIFLMSRLFDRTNSSNLSVKNNQVG